MKQTKYKYGLEVIEFYPHDENELQEFIQRAEDRYYNSIASLDNPLAASIHFLKSPISIALPELLSLHDQGFTIRNDRFAGMQGGALDLTLTKPQSQIDKELIQVHAQAQEEYAARRYARNEAETERQVAITLDRQRREREAAEKAAEQAQLESQRERALIELREAYAA